MADYNLITAVLFVQFLLHWQRRGGRSRAFIGIYEYMSTTITLTVDSVIIIIIIIIIISN